MICLSSRQATTLHYTRYCYRKKSLSLSLFVLSSSSSSWADRQGMERGIWTLVFFSPFPLLFSFHFFLFFSCAFCFLLPSILFVFFFYFSCHSTIRFACMYARLTLDTWQTHLHYYYCYYYCWCYIMEDGNAIQYYAILRYVCANKVEKETGLSSKWYFLWISVSPHDRNWYFLVGSTVACIV